MQMALTASVPSAFRPMMKIAFVETARALGIESYKRLVRLKIEPLPEDQPPSADGLFSPEHECAVAFMRNEAKLIAEFELILNPRLMMRRPINLLLPFCHEMVHMKQWVTGELTMSRNFWQGRPKLLYCGHDHGELAYREQPWEQEAFAKMYGLACRCAKRIEERNAWPSE